MPIHSDTLFPRLKADRSHEIYHLDMGRHMFARLSDDNPTAISMVSVPMLEDLEVQFAHDQSEGHALVSRADLLEEEGWDEMAMIQHAFRNLKEKLGEDLKLSTLENDLIRLFAGGKYDASFLLLSNLWLKLEEDYGANLYAATPSQNLLLIGRQDDRRAILQLQRMIRGVFFDADRDSLLSKAVYQRFDGQWVIVATAF
ncbi:MAG: hypothetical protein RLZZ165_429 [Bacteroidota bacterium]|jgi:uncharacterized protein YtpQ (UPF0354 family)